MNPPTYFYKTPQGKASGPLALGAIQAAMAAGRLEPGLLVSADGQQGWMPLDSLGKTPATNKKLKPCPTCKEPMAKAASRCPHCGANFTSFSRVLLGVMVLLLFLVIMVMLRGLIR